MQKILWTKGLVLGIILLVVGTSILPSINANIVIDIKEDRKNNLNENLVPLDQLDQCQTEDKSQISLYYPYKFAQSFIPALDRLTRVQLKCYTNYNSQGNIIVSIKTYLSGDNLTFISMPISSLPLSKLGDWAEFDFPDIIVIPGQTYYIICSSTSPDSVVTLKLGNDDPYRKGKMWECNRTGWWYSWYSYDLCFMTYGTYEKQLFVDIKGGFGVSAVITHIGTVTMTNLTWEIDVFCVFMVNGFETKGLINELTPGESIKIRSSDLQGIGRATIHVWVQGDLVDKRLRGFLLGQFVLLVSEI